MSYLINLHLLQVINVPATAARNIKLFGIQNSDVQIPVLNSNLTGSLRVNEGQEGATPRTLKRFVDATFNNRLIFCLFNYWLCSRVY